jgi:hypothetical protein
MFFRGTNGGERIEKRKQRVVSGKRQYLQHGEAYPEGKSDIRKTARHNISTNFLVLEGGRG